jgi:hypothetical protein
MKRSIGARGRTNFVEKRAKNGENEKKIYFCDNISIQKRIFSV